VEKNYERRRETLKETKKDGQTDKERGEAWKEKKKDGQIEKERGET
jgi:hypothetical protein